MAGVQYKPGKMGKITAPLNNKKEIGIDGKSYPVSAARLSGIEGAAPKVGDDCEYKIAYQGPDKGAIIFFAVHRPQLAETQATGTPLPASKPIDEGLPPAKPSPRTIVGVYVDKSSTQVTVKESDGMNHVYPCDISLLQYLAKKDIPVKKGETYTFELIQSGDKWIAMKVGPAPEGAGFKSAKEILQENIDAIKSTTTPPPAAATVPNVPVKEESLDEFNARMEKKMQEKRAQEKAAAEVKAKETAEADKRIAENAAYAVELAKQQPAEPTGIAKIVADTKASSAKQDLGCRGCSPNDKENDCGFCEQLKSEGEIVGQNIRSHPAQTTQISTHVQKSYSSDEMILLRNVIAKDCTEPEFKMMMYMAAQYGLDPLLKQIWAVKRNDRTPAVIFVGRDGMLVIAHRSGHFDGIRSWVEYAPGDTEKKKPITGHCEVWRNDMTHSFKTEVLFSEYEQPIPASGYKGLWQTKPSVMIIKVAESVCLRKAFVVSGVYDPDEMPAVGV